MAHILLAEDKEDVGFLMEEVLKHEGHSVILCKDGKKAIEALETQGPFDLIITDVIMPNMDGFDLVIYMKEKAPNIPIIAVSGGGITMSSDDALQSMGKDVDRLFSKPVDITALTKAINELL